MLRFRATVVLIQFKPERRRSGVGTGRVAGAWAVTASGLNEVTRSLSESPPGDPSAAERLLPLVYDELRRLAAARMANERSDHTLDATALVHEAYLRLVGDQRFDGRGHFFAAAAEAMRRILVEAARRKRAEKRGDRAARAVLEPD